MKVSEILSRFTCDSSNHTIRQVEYAFRTLAHSISSRCPSDPELEELLSHLELAKNSTVNALTRTTSTLGFASGDVYDEAARNCSNKDQS